MKDFFINDFQKMVWEDNYQDNMELITGTQRRLVDVIFKAEITKLRDELYDALNDRRIFFGGRVTANTGTGRKNVHSFNCYGAQRSTKPVDSIKNIFADLQNAAQILKTEGGIGFNFNHIRPKGTLIKGVGVGTPGVVAFMEIYDKSAEIITRGSSEDVFQRENFKLKKKIRKGAQMSMLSITHPEIMNYIKAKSVPNMLTKFNMSVIVPDSFMKKLEANENWDFWFPDIHFDKYDDEWNGDFEEWEEKGYPKVVYDTKPAQEIWDFLIETMHKRNEPGIYFIDNANRYNNVIHYQKVTGTNPCLIGSTKVKTRSGDYDIKDLIGKEVEIFNGENWVWNSEFRMTAKKQSVTKFIFQNGTEVVATPYHRFENCEGEAQEVKDFNVGDTLACFYDGIKYQQPIIKIIEDYADEDVYCTTVESNERFLLSNGILSLNCGEISMLADGGVFEKDGIIYKHLGDICNLGSLNLCEYVNMDSYNHIFAENEVCKEGFDFHRFQEDVKLLVRALDNLIDISGYPFDELKTAAMLRRKIGAGIFGYGSALMMMGMRYGSPEALQFTEDLMNCFANTAYQASAELAKEKGPFLLWDAKKCPYQGFIKNSGVLNEKTLGMIQEFGLRNSQILTVAPTGNLSIYAGCISGGIEPVYELDYFRWVIVNHHAKAVLKTMEYPDWERGEWFETPDFKFQMRGDDQVLISRCGKIMIDKNRGLTEQKQVYDYAYKMIIDNYSEEVFYHFQNNGVFDCANDLSAEDHLETFILLSKHVDNSISKCMRIDTTMVVIDDKIVYLDEIEMGEVDTFKDFSGSTLNHDRNTVEISEIYNNGMSNIIKITFDDHSTIECTPNHKIFIDGYGWKKAIDLSIHEKII